MTILCYLILRQSSRSGKALDQYSFFYLLAEVSQVFAHHYIILVLTHLLSPPHCGGWLASRPILSSQGIGDYDRSALKNRKPKEVDHVRSKCMLSAAQDRRNPSSALIFEAMFSMRPAAHVSPHFLRRARCLQLLSRRGYASRSTRRGKASPSNQVEKAEGLPL